MKREDKIYYKNYSLPQQRFLESLGFQSEFKARDIHNDRIFWFYLYDEEGKLDKALDEWIKGNPKRQIIKKD